MGGWGGGGVGGVGGVGVGGGGLILTRMNRGFKVYIVFMKFEGIEQDRYLIFVLLFYDNHVYL